MKQVMNPDNELIRVIESGDVDGEVYADGEVFVADEVTLSEYYMVEGRQS